MKLKCSSLAAALGMFGLLLSSCGSGSHLTGNIQYLRNVHSQFMTFDRDVIVYLPPDYATNTNATYSVLYMHDGQYLMDASTADGEEWGVDETAQRLILAGEIEPIIIVGVYSAGYGTTERINELTPVPEGRSGGGAADAYGKFLTLELKPMIDSQFRTKPEPEHTGIAGSSDGGLVSMYFGLTHSDVFERVGVISPDVRWANDDIVQRVQALPEKLPLVIWEDEGTAEGSSPQKNIDASRALRDALLSKGWLQHQDMNLAYTEIPGGQHDVSDWAARFDRVLRYLYPAHPPAMPGGT